MLFVNFSELLDTAPGFHFLYREGRRGVYYYANPQQCKYAFLIKYIPYKGQ
jgi:hypothetical protein